MLPTRYARRSQYRALSASCNGVRSEGGGRVGHTVFYIVVILIAWVKVHRRRPKRLSLDAGQNDEWRLQSVGPGNQWLDDMVSR